FLENYRKFPGNNHLRMKLIESWPICWLTEPRVLLDFDNVSLLSLAFALRCESFPEIGDIDYQQLVKLEFMSDYFNLNTKNRSTHLVHANFEAFCQPTFGTKFSGIQVDNACAFKLTV